MSTEQTDPGLYDYAQRPSRPPLDVDHRNEELPVPLDTRIDVERRP